MRIAARRIRSALTTTRPLFEEAPEQLREELRWLGQVLSPARDAQVVRERLETALDAEPRELVLGPVRARLSRELNREYQQAIADVRAALDSERYFRLLDALDDLVADLAMLPTAGAPARPIMGDLVRRDAKRLHRAVQAVAESDADSHDSTLHEARKKAKRLRYAAELAAQAGGGRAEKLAERAKAVQEALGQHQDTVVARRRLRQLGAQAYLHGENGFTFGLLHGLERLRAEHAEQEFRDAWARMPRPRTAARWASAR
jgi:CHAD domain-containing protein